MRMLIDPANHEAMRHIKDYFLLCCIFCATIILIDERFEILKSFKTMMLEVATSRTQV